MAPNQVQPMRSSWAVVEPIADQAATMFYGRLFEIDPPIAVVFAHTDTREAE